LKKEAKNFCNLRRPFDPTRTPMSKSFLLLFLKKELLAFTLPGSGSMPIGITGARCQNVPGRLSEKSKFLIALADSHAIA
jgi:hypothetical protein